jgi:hypothetical protein
MSADSAELRQWSEAVSRGDNGALRVTKEALETFNVNGVGPNEAGLYLLLLSSRGYTGVRLWELYEKVGRSAARVMNQVVLETREELLLGVPAPARKLEFEELEEQDLDRR